PLFVPLEAAAHGVIHSFPTRRSADLDLTLHPLQFLTGATQVEDVSPALAERVTDAAGSLAFAGTLQWDANGMRSSGELEAKDLRSEEHTSELQSRENLV